MDVAAQDRPGVGTASERRARMPRARMRPQGAPGRNGGAAQAMEGRNRNAIGMKFQRIIAAVSLRESIASPLAGASRRT